MSIVDFITKRLKLKLLGFHSRYIHKNLTRELEMFLGKYAEYSQSDKCPRSA
jgi:hypothetical protein